MNDFASTSINCRGEFIVITGQNMGPALTPITLSYGPPDGLVLLTDPAVLWPYTTAPCSWISLSQIQCLSLAGVGGPAGAFAFQLSVGGQAGPLFSSSFVAYAPPVINGLSFTPFGTSGGDAFNISGIHVRWGAYRCLSLFSSPFSTVSARSSAPSASLQLSHTRLVLAMRSIRHIPPVAAL